MFLHTFIPQPILFTFGPLYIRWYGVIIAFAATISFILAIQLFKKYKLSLEKLYDLGFYLILFGVIGARIWDVLVEFKYYQNNLWDIFKIWNGGLAIHGAIVAGALTIYFYSKLKKLNFWQVLDIFAPLVALGQAIGRWGNYFNQEIYGPPTNLPFGIPIELTNRMPGFETFSFFHPTFLYESTLNLIAFAILFSLHYLRLHHNPNKGRCPLFNGSIFIYYLGLYSIIRFIVSFWRIDYMPVFYNLRFDQWASLGMLILAIILYFYLRRRHKVCNI